MAPGGSGKLSAYPHTGAQVQQQQHGMQEARMPIGYAGAKYQSNIASPETETFTTEDTELHGGTPQRIVTEEHPTRRVARFVLLRP
jgi:hypothetical protein